MSYPRSGYETVNGLVFFGRMLDKIRLHEAGQLPDDYNLGWGFDDRVCSFLQVQYNNVVQRTLEGGTDEEILEWCFTAGRRPSEEEILIFNHFMMKRGWRDEYCDWVAKQKEKLGMSGREDIQTCFDIHDAEEGRPIRTAEQWRSANPPDR